MTPQERAARLSFWSGPVEPVPLAGGITNTNFTVRDRGRKFVVRIGDDIPVHHVSRKAELAAARAAHATGLAPEILHAEPGALVMPWIEGRALSPEDVRDPAMLGRIVPLLRRCHAEVGRHLEGPAPLFWVFHVCRDYARTLQRRRSRMLPELPRLMAMNDRLEALVGDVGLVFGHNDLLAANILDDGRRLWLLDWEYAGFNSPLFDLGGLASNSEMPAAMHERMFEAYFERPMNDDLRRRAAAMTAASLLRETMWSMVSELVPPSPTFDYAMYTTENLARFEAAYRNIE